MKLLKWFFWEMILLFFIPMVETIGYSKPWVIVETMGNAKPWAMQNRVL